VITLWRRLGPAVVLTGLAILAAGPSLSNGFTLDDIPLLVDNPRVHQLAWPWEYFRQSYWPPELTASLYRPITVLGFGLQWTAGGGAPWLFHAVSALLYVALTLLIYHLARSLLPPRPAWIAAALFAVHPVHVEAVAGVVGQSEILVALLSVAATARYLEARTLPVIPARHSAEIAGLYALACFTKEQGIMLPALLLGAELTVVRDPRTPAERRHTIWPLLRLLMFAAVGFLAARTTVLGGLEGDSPNVAFRGVGLGGRALIMLSVVPEWCRLLFAPWHLQADYMPRELGEAIAPGVMALLGVTLLLLLALTAWRARRAVPVWSLGVLWIAVSLFPVSNVVIPTGILLAERTLLLPSAGAMLMIGALLGGAERTRWGTHPVRRGLVALAAGITLAAWSWRTITRVPVWRSNETLIAATLADAPLSYKIHWDRAKMLARAGQDSSAAAEYRQAMELFPQDPRLLSELGDRRRETGDCGRAIPWYRQALALDSVLWVTRTRLILCYAKSGAMDAAREELAELERHGGGDPSRLGAMLAAFDSTGAKWRPDPEQAP
jgi:hypothetical protein